MKPRRTSPCNLAWRGPERSLVGGAAPVRVLCPAPLARGTKLQPRPRNPPPCVQAKPLEGKNGGGRGSRPHRHGPRCEKRGNQNPQLGGRIMQQGRSTRMNACPDDTDVGLYLLAFRKVRFSRVGNASGRFANPGSGSELPEAAEARIIRRKCKAIYGSLYIAYIMLSVGSSKLLPMPPPTAKTNHLPRLALVA